MCSCMAIPYMGYSSITTAWSVFKLASPYWGLNTRPPFLQTWVKIIGESLYKAQKLVIRDKPYIILFLTCNFMLLTHAPGKIDHQLPLSLWKKKSVQFHPVFPHTGVFYTRSFGLILTSSRLQACFRVFSFKSWDLISKLVIFFLSHPRLAVALIMGDTCIRN